MNIHNAELIISAVKPSQYPPTSIPEIALAGRSNVGKSSFINKLLNRKSLARTSSHPGKTATLNFYNIDNTLYFVDLPGYGYAEVSKAEREKWGNMINTYLVSRPQLLATILLVDARHKPTRDDIAMYNWIVHNHGFCAVVATKYDKLKKSEIEKNKKIIIETLNLSENDVFHFFSAEKGYGRDEMWEFINNLISDNTEKK